MLPFQLIYHSLTSISRRNNEIETIRLIGYFGSIHFRSEGKQNIPDDQKSQLV